jgi:hypothetical protein
MNRRRRTEDRLDKEGSFSLLFDLGSQARSYTKGKKAIAFNGEHTRAGLWRLWLSDEAKTYKIIQTRNSWRNEAVQCIATAPRFCLGGHGIWLTEKLIIHVRCSPVKVFG